MLFYILVQKGSNIIFIVLEEAWPSKYKQQVLC